MCQEIDTERREARARHGIGGQAASARGVGHLFALSAAALLAGLVATGCGSSSPSTTAHRTNVKPATAATTGTGQTTSAQTSPSAATGTTGTGQTTSTQTSPSAATGTATGVGVVTGSAGGVAATLKAGTHRPKVNRSWPIHFDVTKAGKPAKASVSYEYLFAGQVVAHRSHYTFEGRFSDTFRWPASAVGYQLTFRAVIVSGGVVIDLDYPVQVVA
ncbi:MAG TPA: hypothetical protein VMG80_04345 [Solirubrobacteraceae bacterium]|nr:hypothetical protein [Solirubrobacteraceae bacterium]